MIKYRSTGLPAVAEEPSEEILAEQRRIQRESHPRYMREKALREIREARSKDQKTGDQLREEAVANFDFEFPQITKNPGLLHQAVTEVMRRQQEIVTQGQVVGDWPSFYRNIGNEVLKRAGYPDPAEVQREESLQRMRDARSDPK